MHNFFWDKESPDEIDSIPRGLCNIGNTCYFNSVIQPLCHTHSLYSELWKTGQDGDLALSYITVCDSMRINGATEPFAPRDVRSQFVTRVSRFNNQRQHDSHECLRHFLDEIRKEERSTSDSRLTVVDKIFGGHLVTVYICRECDRHRHLIEPCLDISLPVFFEAEENARNEDNKQHEGSYAGERHKRHQARQDNSENEDRGDEANAYKTTISKLTQRLSSAPSVNFSRPFIHHSANSLNDCLKHFSRVEQIQKDYLCEDCLREAIDREETSEDNLKLTSATKQTLIFNPPAVLTIHFKRFELLPGRSRKRRDKVEYPEYLDIAPFCSSHCLRNDPPRNSIWYSLYAVVVHSGSLESGHYVSYVKVREKYENIETLDKFIQQEYFDHNVTSDGLNRILSENRTQEKKMNETLLKSDESKWYLINDSSVRRVAVDSVLNQEAYLLFYERMEANKPLVETKPGISNATISKDCQKNSRIDSTNKCVNQLSIEDSIQLIPTPFLGQMSVAI